MVNSITRDSIRAFLDQLNTPTRIDNDGDLFMVLEADEDFNHDVVIYFFVKDNSLGIYAFAHDYKVPEDKMLDALIAVNKHNADTKYPKAFIKDNTVQTEYWYLLDEEVSEEYIKENCLKMIISLTWRFFVDFKY
ncbi:MAG: YbjN domain-containing protein [Clostridium sp.]|nr:YbjN domain-containing protein [Clostridium sp.]